MLNNLLKRNWLLLIFIFPTMLFSACTKNKKPLKITIEVLNNTDKSFKDVLIEFDNSHFIEQLNEFDLENLTVKINNESVPFQLNDLNNDGDVDQLLVLCQPEKREVLTLQITNEVTQQVNFDKRTQAELSIKEGGEWITVTKKNGKEQFEYSGGSFNNINYLRVPEIHTDHTFFIRYEGPGWESDKIAYRFYLDWRNAVDIFGKKTGEMVLQQVGQDGFDSYHEEADWGMDILKVGSSLGIGSFAFWDENSALRVANTDSITCSIQSNGVIQSSIETNYFGWIDTGKKTDLKSIITINAGSRLTHQQLFISNSIENICTGIVMHEQAELFLSESGGGEWLYMATYGKQSLNNDNLGMVVFFRKADLIKTTEDNFSHIVVLKPKNGIIDYYFGAVWEKDVDSITTKDQFLTYLEQSLYKLNNPLTIKY